MMIYCYCLGGAWLMMQIGCTKMPLHENARGLPVQFGKIMKWAPPGLTGFCNWPFGFYLIFWPLQMQSRQKFKVLKLDRHSPFCFQHSSWEWSFDFPFRLTASGAEIANSVLPSSMPFKYFLSPLFYQPSISLKSTAQIPTKTHDLHLFVHSSVLASSPSLLYYHTQSVPSHLIPEKFSPCFLQNFWTFLQFNRFHQLGLLEKDRACLGRPGRVIILWRFLHFPPKFWTLLQFNQFHQLGFQEKH